MLITPREVRGGPVGSDFFSRLPHALQVVAKSDRDQAAWVERKPIGVARGRAGVRLLTSSPPFRLAGDACSTIVHSAFRVGRDSIGFTYGRSPEECNEAPRLLWSQDHIHRRDPLPPLYDFNVSAIWQTPHYLVFALEADYEYGSHAERMAFWDLVSGAMVTTTPAHWEAEEWADRRARKRLIGSVTDWSHLQIEESGQMLVLRDPAACVQVWPAKRAFAQCK
jgi:hypothetical protein